MNYTALKNRDGVYVLPDDKTFQAAATYADWKKNPGFYEILTDEPGKDSWPITATSFILVQKSQLHAAKGKEVLKFFDWAYKNGQASARDLDYVPMPGNGVPLIEESWKNEITDAPGTAV